MPIKVKSNENLMIKTEWDTKLLPKCVIVVQFSMTFVWRIGVENFTLLVARKIHKINDTQVLLYFCYPPVCIKWVKNKKKLN